MKSITKGLLVTFAFTSAFYFSGAKTKNVILMMGAGIGKQHVVCGAKDKPVYIQFLHV